MKFLDNAGEAKITKTDFAVRVDQYVRLQRKLRVNYWMGPKKGYITCPGKVAMNNGTLVHCGQSMLVRT